MEAPTGTLRIFASRRWSWWRIGLVWVVALPFLAFVLSGAYLGFLDPNLSRAWTNDNVSRAVHLFGMVVAIPYLLLLLLMVTLQAIGQLPVFVLFESDGVRHVASWLGWRRLSKYRLALKRKGSMTVFSLPQDPFKRQMVEIRAGGKSIRVQSYGVISDSDLGIVEQWVNGRGRT
jgi:hypothetical protein